MHRADVVVDLGRFLKPGNAEAGADFDDLDEGTGRKRHCRSKASLDQLVRGYSLFHSQGCANSPECPQWSIPKSQQTEARCPLFASVRSKADRQESANSAVHRDGAVRDLAEVRSLGAGAAAPDEPSRFGSA